MNNNQVSFLNQVKSHPLWICLALLPALTGCATPEQSDPFEGFNRGMFLLNKKADQLVIKPVAQVYDWVLPTPLRIGVANFFDNLSQIPTVINDLLQFNLKRARIDTARFILNSTWGIGGLFDVATKAGLKKREQDFGHTLACWGHCWGLQGSPYLVLPILGPSTVRDTVGRVVTFYMTPYPYFEQLGIEPRVPIRNSLIATQFVSARADLLKSEKILKEVAVDEYIFVREAYLQNRAANTSSFGAGFDPSEQNFTTKPTNLDNLEGPPE